MKIALVAQQPAEDDQIRLRELGRALTDAGQLVTIHTGVKGDAGRCDSGLLTDVPDFAGRLRKHWQRSRPDVVHAVRWTGGLAALSAARGLGIPVVQSFGALASAQPRDPAVPPEPHAGAAATASAERIRLESAIGRSAAAVLAASSHEAAHLVRMGVPRPVIRVVPCGVNTSEFTPDGPASAAGPGRGAGRAPGAGAPRAGRWRLIMVSRPAGHIGTAIRALPRLPRTELVVVGGPVADVLGGDGDYLQLTALAKTVGADDRVTFTGHVSQRDLLPLLRSADLMISTAAYEPDGMAVLKAMACGLPVIASGATGALPDIIIAGTTGMLVPGSRPDLLARQVRHLLAHPMLRSGMSVAAVDRARSRYSWTRVAAETLAVYERVTTAAPRAGG